MKFMKHFILPIFLLGVIQSVSAMGLRAFVAMPLEPGGAVFRVMAINNPDAEATTVMANVAYGLSSTQTVFFAWPYRFADNNEGGQDPSLLYRYLALNYFGKDQSFRLGLLGGLVLPYKDNSETKVQAGFAMTGATSRNQVDADFLWVDGLGRSKDAARFDVSWQYRILPFKRSAWGNDTEWYSVVEMGGRWQEQNNTTYQATIGAQRITSHWIFEGGVVRDLNNKEQTQYLLSARYRL